MKTTTFCDLYCGIFKCQPEAFTEELFWSCLFPQALFVARLLWRCNRDYFKPDLELIAHVKDLTDAANVKAEFHDYYYLHPPSGLLRGFLKVRISGQRLINQASRVFTTAEAAMPGALAKV